MKSGPLSTMVASAPGGNPGIAIPWPSPALVFYRIAAANCWGEGAL